MGGRAVLGATVSSALETIWIDEFSKRNSRKGHSNPLGLPPNKNGLVRKTTLIGDATSRAKYRTMQSNARSNIPVAQNSHSPPQKKAS